MKITQVVLGPVESNCYILCCEKTNQALIIDPGEAEPALFEAVAGYDIPKIVATHGHWDHVSGVPYLQREFGSTLILHYAERECIKKWAKIRDLDIKLGDFVGEGDIIEVGSVKLKALFMPGHSPGHLVLMEESERWLFTGDLLLKGGTGGANVDDGNSDDFVKSINRLRDLEGDWTIYPGHFDATTMAHERDHNPYIKFKVKEAKATDPGAE
jgi:glyoxylase-like metal-dependent hydrolase (beta-lactamase superfamily II)